MSDRRIRELERAAALGDADAAMLLEREQRRIDPPDPQLVKLTTTLKSIMDTIVVENNKNSDTDFIVRNPKLVWGLVREAATMTVKNLLSPK